MSEWAAWVDDWQPGRRISTHGRKKIVLAAGLLSRSGEALDRFGGFLRYLVTSHGFGPGDFLEASYQTRQDADGWRPVPYDV